MGISNKLIPNKTIDIKTYFIKVYFGGPGGICIRVQNTFLFASYSNIFNSYYAILPDQQLDDQRGIFHYLY